MDAQLKLDLTPLGPRSALEPDSQLRALNRLASALEARVPGSAGHARRVAFYASGVARRMGFSRERVARLHRAAALHDIGKVGTPAAIVNKPGPLSDEEFAVVRRHAAIGAWMVVGLGDDELVAVVRHHHERLDGNGYPDGLAGGEIPLGARIVAVADTFDAVASTRPYRAAKRCREALELLDGEAGAQLDPGVVSAFRDYFAGLPAAAAADRGREIGQVAFNG